MKRHAVTALVVIALAAAITLLFGTSGYDAATDPNADIAEAADTYKRCDAVMLALLNGELAEAIADDAHRAERIARALSPAETACTQAESVIRKADQHHPRNVQIGHMRRKTALNQGWLRKVSTALAAYEVAAKTGPADKELAALQELLQ